MRDERKIAEKALAKIRLSARLAAERIGWEAETRPIRFPVPFRESAADDFTPAEEGWRQAFACWVQLPDGYPKPWTGPDARHLVGCPFHTGGRCLCDSIQKYMDTPDDYGDDAA